MKHFIKEDEDATPDLINLCASVQDGEFHQGYMTINNAQNLTPS